MFQLVDEQHLGHVAAQPVVWHKSRDEQSVSRLSNSARGDRPARLSTAAMRRQASPPAKCCYEQTGKPACQLVQEDTRKPACQTML